MTLTNSHKTHTNTHRHDYKHKLLFSLFLFISVSTFALLHLVSMIYFTFAFYILISEILHICLWCVFISLSSALGRIVNFLPNSGFLTFTFTLFLRLCLYRSAWLIKNDKSWWKKMNTKGESSFDGVWHQNDSPGGNVFPASIDRKPKNGVSQSFYFVFS